METASFEVQIKPAKPSIVVGTASIETNALAVFTLRLHAHILQDLMPKIATCVANNGIKFIPANKYNNTILREHLELTGVVGVITHMVFTESKGIWQVETTKVQVVGAMGYVTETLAKYHDHLSESKINYFALFPYPRALNTYAAP
eukprot:10165603-Ditylum_brightwellii.AAC.1